MQARYETPGRIEERTLPWPGDPIARPAARKAQAMVVGGSRDVGGRRYGYTMK